MFLAHEDHHVAVWAPVRWRSSDNFIITTISLALFTDELLFAFMIPLLPTILEQRIGLDPSLTQKYTSIFLTEGAFVSIVSSPILAWMADVMSSRKALLLALLVLAMASVGCLSATTSLIGLFIGRFFQCIVSQGLSIVGMATLAENIGSEHMGWIAGLTSTLTAAGTTAGPILAGSLFEAGGYWCAWTGAVGFLMLDFVMRLVMKEKPASLRHAATGEEDEREPLVAGEDRPNYYSSSSPDLDSEEEILSFPPMAVIDEAHGWRFYLALFRERRFVAGVFCAYVFAVLVGSFQSTLAVHVQTVFGWKALQVGILMAIIQSPGVVFAAPVGMLKDKMGSGRSLTTAAFLLLAPFIILSGLPGDRRFALPGVVAEVAEEGLYVACVAMMGCLMSLLNGVGSMEATETVDAIEKRDPGRFGGNEGYSRALAVTSMAWMAGLMTGPGLAGILVQRFGYLELQCCLGVISSTAGLVASLYLGPSRSSASKQADA
ncbi:major facilitator superfamily domain-containing protein [Aspergillus egyptiacus]|nr:major facilitator superfamily domain-containing protein [Aspergillus egyptiacus]